MLRFSKSSKVFLFSFIFFCTINSTFAFPNKEQMDSKVGSVPTNINDAVFKDPKKNLEPLVKNLLSGISDNTQKAKIIHDWICNNISYDTELLFSGKNSSQDYANVLKNKKALCSGYSSVFMEMCKIAGLQAIKISGHSKGFGYTGKVEKNTNHEWNAVKIGNDWKLIDCCWDAGYVDYMTFIKSYSTEFFMLEPEYFIYSHLPADSAYQYLPKDKIRSIEQFEKEPNITGKFFKTGFDISNKMPNYLNEINKEVSYDIKIQKSGVSSSASIYDSVTGQTVENINWVDRKGSTFTYSFDVPDTNEYTAVIYSRSLLDENYPDRFSIADFEQNILPNAEALITDGSATDSSITKHDFEIFTKSFQKVEDNDCYYYIENLFNTQRIDIVKKVFKLLNIDSGNLLQVLEFKIKASSNYDGAGFNPKYPVPYGSYILSTSTHLVTPRIGSLKRGETYKFQVESKDYSGLGIKSAKSIIPFTKNKKTGYYELDYTVGSEDTVIVFGTKNNKNYSGIFAYPVE